MNLAEIETWMSTQVWLMHEPTLRSMWHAVRDRSAAAGPEARTTRRPQTSSRMSDGVGVIPIYGPIVFRPNVFTAFFGGSSVKQIERELLELASDPEISAIVLDVDSPGGTGNGLIELADTVRQVRQRKPVVAIADTFMASAAYWIGSQASTVLMLRSGEIGSIGVFVLHVDFSRALDADGVTPTYIFAGERKIDANAFQPLSDRARDDLQKRVDDAYAAFIRGVAKGRGRTIQQVERFADGRLYGPAAALSLGLVDDFASGLSTAIERGRSLSSAMAVQRDRDRLQFALARTRSVA